jgi:hypothetical protein
MAALTEDRYVEQHTHEVLTRVVVRPVKAATKIFAGSMVGVDSSGNAMPAGLIAGGTLYCAGVSRAQADNSAGAAGDVKARIERGIFPMNNSAAGDAITDGDIGKLCYVVDDNTVAKTDGAAARAAAGRIFGMEGTSVLVEFGVHSR